MSYNDDDDEMDMEIEEYEDEQYLEERFGFGEKE